jgi:hypothetical protein
MSPYQAVEEKEVDSAAKVAVVTVEMEVEDLQQAGGKHTVHVIRNMRKLSHAQYRE